MFDFTSTIPSVIDYKRLVKAQKAIQDLSERARTLTRLYGDNPVPEDLDYIMMDRSYYENTGVPLVMRGSKAVKIGGSKETFVRYEVQPIIITDSYSAAQLNEYKAAFVNRPEEVSANVIRDKFAKMAIGKAFETLNGIAIMNTKGGDISVPMVDGNGSPVPYKINYGKIHGTSDTANTQNTISGITAISSTSKLSTFLKNVRSMVTTLVTYGTSIDGASFLLGEDLFYTVFEFVDSANSNATLDRNIKISDVGDDYFVINNRKYELDTDSFVDPLTNTTHKICGSKELKILGNKRYNYWAFLKPDEHQVSNPVLYFLKDWYVENPSARQMIFHSRQALIPDPDSIASATMMA